MTANKHWQGYGERELLCTVGGNVSWYIHWGKLNGGFTKKNGKKQTNLKIELPKIHLSTSGYFSEGNKNT